MVEDMTNNLEKYKLRISNKIDGKLPSILFDIAGVPPQYAEYNVEKD